MSWWSDLVYKVTGYRDDPARDAEMIQRGAQMAHERWVEAAARVDNPHYGQRPAREALVPDFARSPEPQVRWQRVAELRQEVPAQERAVQESPYELAKQILAEAREREQALERQMERGMGWER